MKNGSLAEVFETLRKDAGDIFPQVLRMFTSICKMDKDEVIGAYGALEFYGIGAANLGEEGKRQLDRMRETCVDRMVALVVEARQPAKQKEADDLRLCFHQVTDGHRKIQGV